MAADPNALLVVDVGTLFTHVALVDQVAGEYRVIARAEALSTLEAPDADAWPGIRQALRQLEDVTARPLAREDGPLMPHRPDGSGVDAMVVTTSAAGTLPVVVAAISSATSGLSLRRVARSTYTAVIGSVTLDEQSDVPLGPEESWLDYQLSQLMALPSATVLMAGGVEGGNSLPLERLAHMLGFTVLRREHAGSREFAHVLFAGNSAALDVVHEALSTIAPISPTANIRPTLDAEQLMPARYELIRLYNEMVLPRLPGYSRLRSMATAPLRNNAEGLIPLARFLNRHFQRETLLLDLGSMTTAAVAVEDEQIATAIRTNWGPGYGAPGLLQALPPGDVTRWLPFELDDQALREHLLNRMLRPQITPISPEDLWIEHALAREALRHTLDDLYTERPNHGYTFVVASGGVLTHAAHPAQALLVLLDALHANPTHSLELTDLFVDWDGLLPMCGALAWTYPDAAACLLRQDALRNGPLASVVIVSGELKPGEVAVEVELTPLEGQPTLLTVPAGEIRRIPLPQHKRATLRLRPAKQARIGANEPGAEVLSDVAAIQGSTLGVVIDARGRPLPLGDPAANRAQVWGWYAQLGVVPAQNPYRPAEPEPLPEPLPEPVAAPPAAPTPEALPQAKEQQTPDWLADEPQEPIEAMPPPEEFGIEVLPPGWLDAADPGPPESPDGVLDLGQHQEPRNPNDFSDLRAELEQQKPKRGFFRRK